MISAVLTLTRLFVFCEAEMTWSLCILIKQINKEDKKSYTTSEKNIPSYYSRDGKLLYIISEMFELFSYYITVKQEF